MIGRSLPPCSPRSVCLAGPGHPGDIEIVQLGCAVAVFAFLPLCQLKRANVLVGVFTKNLPARYRAMFDLAANLLFLVLTATLALQLGHGTAEKFRNQRHDHGAAHPGGLGVRRGAGFGLAARDRDGLHGARSALEIGTNRAIGPPPAGEH